MLSSSTSLLDIIVLMMMLLINHLLTYVLKIYRTYIITFRENCTYSSSA